MALPSDMQIVPIVLLKEDVRQIDQAARKQRMSRSAFLRSLIEGSRQTFFSPDCFQKETKETSEKTAASVA